MENHLSNSNLNPINKDEINQFVTQTNTSIINRGKLMTKNICDKLSLTDYYFYNEI